MHYFHLNYSYIQDQKNGDSFNNLTRLTWLMHTSFFTLKMESVHKITIFDLKMMVKSGLEKIFLTFLHEEANFF